MDNELIKRLKRYIPGPGGYDSQFASDMVAAIDALTQQQEAEPVAYQSRMRPDWYHRHAWTPWESCSKGTYEDFKRVPVNAGWIYEARALYLHPPKPAAQPDRCEYCDGTGDVHSFDGEWLGSCAECLPAAQPQVPEGYRLVSEPKPNQNSQSFADRLAYWRTERPSEWLMDEFIRDAQILEAKLAAKEEWK